MTTSHILLIDDDPAVLVALPETLHLWMPGSIVDICGSARLALDRIESTDYDAIVSDIRMPDMDGLALLDRIRMIRPNTPTLLITGHGDHSLAVQALHGGAFDYILKPVDREYFINSLNRAVRMRQLTRQTEEQKVALERYANEMEQLVRARTQELLEQLELRVQERTADLVKANEELQRELAERTLKGSQPFLHAVVEAVPCLIVLIDPKDHVLLFNRIAEDLTGYQREEVTGKNFLQLFIPPTWTPIVRRRLAHPDSPEAQTPSEHPWLTKTGQERVIAWHCTPVASPDYDKPCVLGVGIDSTGRHLVEHKMQILNAALDQKVRTYAKVVQDLEASKTDLQEKILDLEKFQEVVVGRELKMMALEKQVTALQRERDRLKAELERV